MCSTSEGTPRRTQKKGSEARVRDNPPLIYHQSKLAPSLFSNRVRDAFATYRQKLPDHLKVLLDHYQLKDIAIKVVGVGSVGTRCGVLLLMAGDNDPLFLQVKEARISVLAPYAGKSRYANQGQRVVEGQRLMQSASDMFLGWTEGKRARQFYIRQLRDAKIKPMVELMDHEMLTAYGECCGWALARAHAQAGDAAGIAGYLGKGSSFDEALTAFAVSYTEQNDRDYEALLAAIRDGRVPAPE